MNWKQYYAAWLSTCFCGVRLGPITVAQEYEQGASMGGDMLRPNDPNRHWQDVISSVYQTKKIFYIASNTSTRVSTRNLYIYEGSSRALWQKPHKNVDKFSTVRTTFHSPTHGLFKNPKNKINTWLIHPKTLPKVQNHDNCEIRTRALSNR